ECRDKRYFIRRLVEDRVLNGDVLAHVDGEEIFFGQESHEVAKPSPLLCNVHLAVGLVLLNSGAAEMISKILQDEESFNDGNVDGDYWYQVSASYLDRELTALQGFDTLAMDDNTDDNTDADTDGNLSRSSHHTI
ncbi:hypothetical protein V1524DRAFT_340952, partial [Lipomyces starkeyi]